MSTRKAECGMRNDGCPQTIRTPANNFEDADYTDNTDFSNAERGVRSAESWPRKNLNDRMNSYEEIFDKMNDSDGVQCKEHEEFEPLIFADRR